MPDIVDHYNSGGKIRFDHHPSRNDFLSILSSC